MKFKIKKEEMSDKIKWVKTGRKKTKVLIACGMVIVLIAGGIYGFGIKKKTKAQAGKTPIMSAQAEIGNLSTKIEGTGTLVNSDSEDIEIPLGIKVKKVKVSVGDEVKKGDTLATVDKVSLSAELLATQEELDSINKQMNDESDNDMTQYVESFVDGRVKKIYAKKNEEVGTTILDKGSLMLISMDGKMAVDIETSVSVKVGNEVTVTLKDGSTVTGTVVKAGDDSCTVTMTDNGTGYQEKVTVSTSSGKTMGSGKLYINKEAKVTAASGTVKSILVSENEKISEGDELLKLKGDFQTEAYLSLEIEKANLEEKLESLLTIAQNDTITAKSDGIVTAVYVTDSTTSGDSSNGSDTSDSSSGSSTGGNSGSSRTGVTQTSTVDISKIDVEKQGASSKTGFLLTSAENNASDKMTVAKDEAGTTKGEAGITKDESGTTKEESSTIKDESRTIKEETGTAKDETGATKEESGTTKDEKSTTKEEASTTKEETGTTEENDQNGTTETNQVTTITSLGNAGIIMPEAGKNPVTTISGGEYQGTVVWSPSDSVFQADIAYSAKVILTAKKGYTFAANPSIQIEGGTIAGMKVNGDAEQNTLTFTVAFQKTSAKDSSTQENNQNQAQNGNKSGGAGGMAGSGSASRGSVGSSAGSSGSGTSSSGSSSSSSDTTSENTELTTAFTLASGKNMTLNVNVDELDILSVSVGQKAALTLDAVENQEFEGEITGIDKNGTSNGGVTKYAVEITVPKEDTMLSGMNVSASIIVSEAPDVLLIPAAAVSEEGNASYVYTEKNESTGELSGKTEVETGATDGNQIEITSGISEGDTVYYQIMNTGNSDSQNEANPHEGMGGGMGGFGDGAGQGGRGLQGGQNGNRRRGENPQGGGNQ